MLAGCSTAAPGKSNVSAKFQAVFTDEGWFDTFVEFTAYVSKTDDFNRFSDLLKQDFTYYHQLFDKYNNYEGVNNIKTINDQAGIAPVSVDPEMMEMLKLAKEWYDISEGYFDITLGAVLNVWHEYREEGMLLNGQGKDGLIPSQEELEKANQCVGWKFVELDEAKQTVYLNNSCASLDVGGIAKGFAVERVARTLEENGLQAGIVNGGGNIRIIGTKPNGEPWSVGIQNPDKDLNAPSLDSTLYKESMSMVTSGDYQRYYTVGDTIYHHIIDPKTLQPGRQYRAASIVVKDSGLADIMSKIAFLMPYEKAKSVIEAHGGNAIWLVEEKDAFDAEYSEVIDGIYIAVTEGLVDHMRIMKRK